MPFYEYKSSDLDNSCDYCNNVFEVMQSIHADPLKECPQCHQPVDRLISLPAAFIDRNRQANQYNDVKVSKYWRDKNGDRHRVTPADGSANSPTTSSRITASPAEIEAKKRRDAAKSKKQRSDASYSRFRKRIGK